MAGHDDEHPANQVTIDELLEDEPGHDGLARSGIVGDEETDAGIGQDVVIDRFNLVGQGIDLTDADGQLGIELVGQAQAMGLNEQKQVLGVVQLRQGRLAVELDLGQLLVADPQGLIGVAGVLENDLQAIVPGARLEGLHDRGSREERRLDPLSGREVHVRLPTLCADALACI